MKRVAVLAFIDLEEVRENPGTLSRFLDAMSVKPFAAAGLREGVNIRLVPHVVPMRGNWDETVPKAVREIANGKYDGAVVEGGYLTRRLQEAAPDLPIAAYLYDPVGERFAKSGTGSRCPMTSWSWQTRSSAERVGLVQPSLDVNSSQTHRMPAH